MNCTARRSIALAVVTLIGCADSVPSTAPAPVLPESPPAVRMRGTVDVLAGTLTFEPVTASGGSLDVGRGVSAAIYGNQGVTVRIYNSPVVVTASTPGKKRYSANVGVRNLLAHRIGDEQAGAAAHNLGIFVFVSAGPTVAATSSPCSPACAVTVVNQHGIFAFSAPGQRYWYWPYQLGAAGSGIDTTISRNTWTFEADTQVTAFRFDVLVSAAWPTPFDTRWKVEYGADSLPYSGTEPGWVHSGGASSTAVNSPSVSMITITTPIGARLTFFRIDSLNTATNAYIEARFRVNTPPTFSGPEVSFGIDDQIKFISAGASSSRAGFLTGSGSLNFQSGHVAVTTTSFHIYQIRKYAADSVVLYIDGVRRIHKTHSVFPARLPGSAYGFYFGPLGVGAGASVSGNSSTWDYVIYEIGVSQP